MCYRASKDAPLAIWSGVVLLDVSGICVASLDIAIV